MGTAAIATAAPKTVNIVFKVISSHQFCRENGRNTTRKCGTSI
jgi:hypothetical protein